MSDLNWLNDVAIESLSQEQQRLYATYKAAYKAATAARASFETAMQALAPDGAKLVFNYRFGKLSVAVTEGNPIALVAKPKPQRQSLDAWLAQQKANGGSL